MSTLNGPAFEEPGDATPPPVIVADLSFVRAPWVTKPWLRSALNGRWCVVYRYVADSPNYRMVHRAETPADLVRWMRDELKGNPYVIVCKVWEAA